MRLSYPYRIIPLSDVSPFGLDECQSAWAITAKQPSARSAPSTPPPLTPPAKAPVEKGAKRSDGADVRWEV